MASCQLKKSFKELLGEAKEINFLPDEVSLICPPGKAKIFLQKKQTEKIELVTRPVAYQPKAIERIVVKSLSYGNELMPSQQRAVVDAFHKFTLFWHLSRDLSSKKSVAATGRSVLSRSVSYLHPAPSSHFSHLLFTGNATELYYQLTCILGALF